MRAVDAREPQTGAFRRHRWRADGMLYRCATCGVYASVVKRGPRRHAMVYYSQTYGKPNQSWSLVRPTCREVSK